MLFQRAKSFSKILFCVILLMMAGSVSAQNLTLHQWEDSLRILTRTMQNNKNEMAKAALNSKLITSLQQALSLPNAFKYSFDSVKTIACLTPDDNKFRLFNWNIRHKDGSFTYYGIIQMNPKQIKTDTNKLIMLTDLSANISEPDTLRLHADRWFGAMYYKMIQTAYKGKNTYMLLGWDGNTVSSQKKIIEVLRFTKDNEPVFGASIFAFKGNRAGKLKRVVMEYSANASMSLKYEKQVPPKGKKPVDMIVFDDLVPLDPTLKGQYSFYVPETSVVNGLIFKNGIWVFEKDVDARNPKEKHAKKLPKPIPGILPKE